MQRVSVNQGRRELLKRKSYVSSILIRKLKDDPQWLSVFLQQVTSPENMQGPQDEKPLVFAFVPWSPQTTKNGGLSRGVAYIYTYILIYIYIYIMYAYVYHVSHIVYDQNIHLQGRRWSHLNQLFSQWPSQEGREMNKVLQISKTALVPKFCCQMLLVTVFFWLCLVKQLDEQMSQERPFSQPKDEQMSNVGGGWVIEQLLLMVPRVCRSSSNDG